MHLFDSTLIKKNIDVEQNMINVGYPEMQRRISAIRR